MQKFKLLIPLLPIILSQFSFAQTAKQQAEVKALVSKSYIHGLPYKQAKSLSPQVLPVLQNLLYNVDYADYKANIVLCIGIVGKSEGFKILQDYFYNHQGEMDYSTFTSVLITLPAFGHIALNGDEQAMKLLSKLANPDNWNTTGLNFSYKNYTGKPMGLLISKLAVQGLGISGKPEALNLLIEMSTPSNKKYKKELQNDIKDAIQLNKQIQNEGAAKVFEKETTL